MHFRADSMLGVAGLVDAMRAGSVTIANAVGNGVADDKLDLHLRARPDPLLPRRGADPAQRRHLPAATSRTPCEHVLDRLDELVVKPVDGSGGKGLVDRPAARRRRPSTRCASSCIADPRGWIAQPVVQLSTVPTLIDGRLAPRHVDLRPFAVNDGDEVWVLPGGLTRVALPEGELIVNSSQGGGSKDTWVLADRRPARQRAEPAARQPPRSSS